MIKGMTGFGFAQLATNKMKAVIEIKSLNHKYFDISYYLPAGFSSLENKIKNIVQRSLERGRVTVSVKILRKPMNAVYINKEFVKKYLSQIKKLKKEFHLKGDITISEIVKLPGVLESEEAIINPGSLWPALEKEIKRAIDGLVVMRKREGASLSKDLNIQVRQMLLQINKIRKRTEVILNLQKRKLKNEEFSSYQKSIDTNEELSRLKHYVLELKHILKSTHAVGKEIDFIAQEMQRETNTIGAKIQDKVISNSVISVKSKIEKIREQAQNIE